MRTSLWLSILILVIIMIASVAADRRSDRERDERHRARHEDHSKRILEKFKERIKEDKAKLDAHDRGEAELSTEELIRVLRDLEKHHRRHDDEKLRAQGLSEEEYREKRRELRDNKGSPKHDIYRERRREVERNQRRMMEGEF